MKYILLAIALIPCLVSANDWVYEEQTSDFAPTRLQAYLDSDSGNIMSNGKQSQASIVISVDKKDPFKYNPRANILFYNDYPSVCYRSCLILFNIDGEIQEPLEAENLTTSSYKLSDSPSFINKINNAKSIKIAAKSAEGNMIQFEFKPATEIDTSKLPIK